MFALFLTLFSLVLTIVLGAVFLVGLHRVVQWSVTRFEQRGRTHAVAVTLGSDGDDSEGRDDRELTAH